jgi:hypothetical protein
MTNLHRSPPMNQSKTDFGIVNESQLLRFGISDLTPTNDISDFKGLHSGKQSNEVQLYTFDILALGGGDLRKTSITSS